MMARWRPPALVAGNRPCNSACFGARPTPSPPRGGRPAVGGGPRQRWSGAEIDGDSALAVSGLHPGWIDARADWVAAFPLGVDVILCDGARFAAPPRTTPHDTEGCWW